MIEFLLKLLGLGQGASILNNVAGAANHATLAALAVWAWGYRDAQVIFTLTVGEFQAANFQTTAGAVMVLAGILWGLGEVLRRSRGPSAPRGPWAP